MSDTEKPQVKDALIGQTLGEYHIEHELGRGGMGVVYLARHVQLGREVAIKVMRSDALHDPSARERFLREEKALARVKAPGLVEIISVGEALNGMPYLVMEHLDGQTLGQRLQQVAGHRLSVDVALGMCEQLAATLAELHKKEVVHRDLKPDNVMLVRDAAVPGGERTKILDLGIAKLRDELVALTRAEHQPGTQLYMSPEACAGEPDLDGQADVYSLGCMLYELLCGRPPFANEDGGKLMVRHIQQRPQPPRHYNPELPPAIDHFVLDLLDKDPSARPNAAEAAERIQSLRRDPQQPVAWSSRWRHQASPGARIALRVGMPLLILLCAALLTYWGADFLLLFQSEMVKIPGGSFVSGSSQAEKDEARQWAQLLDKPTEGTKYRDALDRTIDRERPSRPVIVRSFWLDRYEATNQDVANFLQQEIAKSTITIRNQCPTKLDVSKIDFGKYCAYGGDKPLMRLSDDNDLDPALQGVLWKESRITTVSKYAKYPAVRISWHLAKLFCEKNGKRLPTSLEFEYAARNGSRHSKFAWGDERPTCSTILIERQLPSAEMDISGKFVSCNPNQNVFILAKIGVMSLDMNMWGVHDLAGSVQEWTVDKFEEPGSPTSDAEHAQRRVLRGGGWNSDFLGARAAAIFQAFEDGMMAAVGFRCAQSAPVD